MPYDKNADLPESVTHVLPDHAQDIYRKAFNSAWDEYRDPSKRRDDSSQEEVAHRVAWQAVKKTYEKGTDDMWQPKSKY
jgi:cation transport regulator